MRKQEEQQQSLGSVTETVLVLQGGGSLGAYECGVYKTLAKRGIKFDILAGSSIGAINSSIICSAQNADKDTAQVLEDFWLTLAESDVPSPFLTYSLLPFAPLPSTLLSVDKMMAILSSMYSVTYGNPKAFTPRWFNPDSSDYFFPYKWNYLYDTTLLKNTLSEYIDFRHLNTAGHDKNTQGNNDNKSRLIITAADIQKGEPIIFDSYKMDIDADSIVACAGYPFYGIQWSTKDGRYLWDGSLLTNTPMLDAINASPQYNKRFYIVDIFPREQNELPTNMVEVWHRARDIIFMDKTNTNIQMLKIREKQLSLLKKIHGIISADDTKMDEKSKAKFKEIESEYNELVHGYGAVIEDVMRIGRKEKMHYLFEDGDFSAYRIKKLIREGEEDAMKALELGKGS
ncbi:MAG TPA: patatin-like phospholipase family protein [Candidatus Nitrosopolaris sp.]|nr:patatin-like phospholipase family protein [Candidatus Nitrosopolaris sp.]